MQNRRVTVLEDKSGLLRVRLSRVVGNRRPHLVVAVVLYAQLVPIAAADEEDCQSTGHCKAHQRQLHSCGGSGGCCVLMTGKLIAEGVLYRKTTRIISSAN